MVRRFASALPTHEPSPDLSATDPVNTPTDRTLAPPACEGRAIRVRGLVQGVGFRPTVWRIAQSCGIAGEVWNDAEGVMIRAWGDSGDIARFTRLLRERAPPLARIDAVESAPLRGTPIDAGFHIHASRAGDARTGIVPDSAICVACTEETRDPASRRYRYPFANCTHCGPRLSIVGAIPYDRASTTMRSFAMCGDCRAEYEDPNDRRFHAQPIACPECGPRAWLEGAEGRCIVPESLGARDAVDAARILLLRGNIVAVKGLGGFHLACDATDERAVARLRAAKRREAKPFALMARDFDLVRRCCAVSPEDAAALRSPAAPIMIMPALAGAPIAAGVAPGANTLGFMLPYSPLHALLLEEIAGPIVMTSGNVSDEPQCTGNDEARERLRGIADYILMHDRDIARRVDDSVVRVMAGARRVLRRARGHAPASLPLPPGFASAVQVLAMGGELKNTFCLAREGEAILSHHIGDLEEVAANADYAQAIADYLTLFEHHAGHHRD